MIVSATQPMPPACPGCSAVSDAGLHSVFRLVATEMTATSVQHIAWRCIRCLSEREQRAGGGLLIPHTALRFPHFLRLKE